MYAILAFDTEDVFFPAKYGIDDIPGWLAEIMTEVGITGTFFVMGEKARSMLERGNTKALAAMAKHDIASHQQGNCRPLVPQVAEKMEWDDAVEAYLEYEDTVNRDLREAFGKEAVALSRHNCYFAAQHVASGGRRGLPYMYGLAKILKYDQPMWYGGALTFQSGPCLFGGLDTIYSEDSLFRNKMATFNEFIENGKSRNWELMVAFGCHPCRVMTKGWQEYHVLASGMYRKPEELGWLYDVKTPRQAETAKANFRIYCEALRDHPDIEVVGIEEAAKLFGNQPDEIPRDMTIEYALSIIHTDRINCHSTFSPAELTCAMAESLVYAGGNDGIPGVARRQNVLGPREMPVTAPEKDSLTQKELIKASREVLAVVDREGHLPANIQLDNELLGIGQFTVLAARAYHAQTRGNRYEKLLVPIAPRYPDEATAIDNWIRKSLGEHWALPLDFDTSRLRKHARLQTWSLKPAWLNPPLGANVQNIRMPRAEF